MNKKKDQFLFIEANKNKTTKKESKEELVKKNKLIISEYEKNEKKTLLELINPDEECYKYVYYNYIKIIRSINLNEWYKMKNKWIKTDTYFDTCRGKFFSIKHYIILNLKKLYFFNLHNITGKNILDLGCGSGLVLYIFKLNNNKVLGLDIKYELFDDMLSFFGITKIKEKIKPKYSIKKIKQKFDIIIATSIKFDSLSNNKNWTTDDWLFFLNDIKNYLTYEGKLYLDLNKYDKIPGYNNKIAKLFIDINAEQITKYQYIFTKSILKKIDI